MVAWFRRRDSDQELHALPYQRAPSPPMTPELSAACERAVHVITAEGETLRAARAVLFVLQRCGWSWTARIARIPPLIWLAELGYWIVARNRRFFARFMFRNE